MEVKGRGGMAVLWEEVGGSGGVEGWGVEEGEVEGGVGGEGGGEG